MDYPKKCRITRGLFHSKDSRRTIEGQGSKRYLPHMFPESHAIMNHDWRYICYQNGSQEPYDVRKDPNEWNNMARKAKFTKSKRIWFRSN